MMVTKVELERRRKAVREMMKKRNLDVLVVQSPFGAYWGGAVRYLADVRGGLEGTNIVFSIDGDMTLIGHRNAPSPVIMKASKEVYGVQDWRGVGINSQFNFLEDAKVVAGVVNEKRPRSIGLVGFTLMQAVFYDRLLRELPRNIWMEDATLALDEIRWVKSEEEMKLCEQAAAMNDAGLEACVKALKPGKTEREIVAEVYRAVMEAGSEGQLISFASGPPGTNLLRRPPSTTSRTLKDGDTAYLMVECSGIGGYFTENGRHMCLGRVPKELQQAFDIATEFQSEVAKLVKPGANIQDLINKMKEVNNDALFMQGMGYGHGQGLDIMEKPVILPDEYVKIQKGMNVAIHPGAIVGTTTGWVSDNYEVTDGGLRRLHKCPYEIFVS